MAKSTSKSAITINIRGYDDAVRRLGIVRSAYEKDVTNIMTVWAEDTAQQLRNKRYPPELANQKYVRTGLLGRSWKGKRVKMTTVVISNNANSGRSQFYARYVVGDDRGVNQAQIHKGRWWIARETILVNHVPELVEKLDNLYLTRWAE